jgi:hypothetical protein
MDATVRLVYSKNSWAELANMVNDRQPSATRASWKIHACPKERVALNFGDVYTSSEFEQIQEGLVPREMEDKWFIFFEDSWLFIHRSWTGFCIYGVRFERSSEGAAVVESWVSRNKEQYGETRTDHDEKLLKS